MKLAASSGSNMTQPEGPAEVRHRLADRLFHWVMAASVFVLGATAFLPILGIQFNWVPVHWYSGVVLAASVLFHFYRVAAVHGISRMLPKSDDGKEAVRRALNRSSAGLEPAKYDSLQKAFHWAAALAVLATAVSGLVMLAKIDTVFWQRNPSILSDFTWGVIYSVHGFGAMALLFLVIVHIYFSLIPAHRDLLSSMIWGPGPLHARKDE